MVSYSTLSDSALLKLLINGDKVAYTEIYDRYKWILHKHAFQKLGDREEAKDAVQVLFMMLWTNRESLDPHTNLAAYLYTATRNRVLNVIAHQQVESKYIASLEHSILKGEYIVDNHIREQELTALIEKGIASLPAKMRQIFELSRNERLSHREIGETLSLSEQTVRTQVRNALRILKLKVGLISFLTYLFDAAIPLLIIFPDFR